MLTLCYAIYLLFFYYLFAVFFDSGDCFISIFVLSNFIIHCSGNKWMLNTLFGKCFIYVRHQKLCKYIEIIFCSIFFLTSRLTLLPWSHATTIWGLFYLIKCTTKRMAINWWLVLTQSPLWSSMCLVFWVTASLIAFFVHLIWNCAMDAAISIQNITNVSPLLTNICIVLIYWYVF